MKHIIQKMINKADVILFDLDGTLIDTEKLYFRFWKEACAYYGFTMSDNNALFMRSLDRETAIKYFNDISGGLLDYDQTRNKRIELMNDYFNSHDIEVKDGAKELLILLKEKGKKIYIVTANKEEKAYSILARIGFIDLIDGVISSKSVRRGKPYPDVYLKACEIIKKPPQEVVVFEDSPHGLKSAYDAGCFTVMVEDLSPYKDDMDYVNAHIKSLKEIT